MKRQRKLKNDLISRKDLIEKIFPLGMHDDGRYTISAKSVKYAIDNSPPTKEVDKIFDELVEGIADMLPNKIYNIEGMDISEATRFGETNALRKVLCLVAEVKKRYESEEL